MEARKRSSHVQEDRLSNLPEPVLHHILSFLDMKYVIPTSLLSKRWQNLWFSLPFLSFDKGIFHSCLLHTSENHRYRKFPSFVNKVFFIRDTCPIQSFDLFWRRHNDDDDDAFSKSDHVDQWFRAAVLRSVKEIYIELASSSDLFQFPDCLFTFKSLTSLTLCLFDESSGAIETMKVKLADKISLPSLKTLHLQLLDLSEYDNLFDILFLGCPALETLFLIECEFTGSEVLTISSVNLKHLRIDMNCDVYQPLEVFVIHASNLLDYFWESSLWCEFSLDGLSSLESANIDPGECYNIKNCKDSKDLKMLVTGADDGMMECLKGLYNVKNLTLSSACLQLISELPSELERWSAPFSNLRYLNLHTWLTRGCFEVTMFLLKNSPKIETLVLHMDPINSEKTVERGVESSFNLKLHHLKVVKILKFSGCKNELQHLKILLGNAEALEKMTIVEDSDKVNNAKRWNVIASKVLTLPRASSDVTINFQASDKMDSYHCKSMKI